MVIREAAEAPSGCVVTNSKAIIERILVDVRGVGARVFWRGDLLDLLPFGTRWLFLDMAWLRQTDAGEDRAFGLWEYQPLGMFKDHFPEKSGMPLICPGVILVEMAFQTGSCLEYLATRDQPSRNMVAREIVAFKFRGHPVMPGTVLLAEVINLGEKRGLVMSEARIYDAANYRSKTAGWIAGGTLEGAALPRET